MGTLVEVVKNITNVICEVIGGNLCPRNRGHIKRLESSQSGVNNLAAGGNEDAADIAPDKRGIEISEYAYGINAKDTNTKDKYVEEVPPVYDNQTFKEEAIEPDSQMSKEEAIEPEDNGSPDIPQMEVLDVLQMKFPNCGY